MASSAEHTIWWHIYPLGFKDTEKAGDLELTERPELLRAGLGFAVAQTPDPGARPGDPALVPGHSWVILSS